ncbi:MAG: hypothetical protein K0S55_1241 [Clostridia bacterium]|nr:hypothetical protein [Clostridia bacterium]
MWVKFEIVPSDQKIIFFPSSIEMDCGSSIEVKFGRKSVEAEIQYFDDFEFKKESSFNNPNILRLTNELKETLLIQESLTYQIKIVESNIIIGPIIGLLLGMQTSIYNPSHMKKYTDRLGIYNKIGGLIYAFSPKFINWKNHTTYGLFYNIATSDWEYGHFPLPEVIYRRDFHQDPMIIKKLEKYTGNRLFNSYRFSKYELYDFIGLNKRLNRYLPPTELSLWFDQVKRFIDQYTKVILKPIDLSRGRGLCIIEKVNSACKVFDYRYRQPIISMLSDNEALENFFSENQSFFNKYLIQKYLPLARIGNSIFDIRVVMQKQKDKGWECSGIECRVSKENFSITNISRGGHALTLDEALQQSFIKDYELIPQQIDDFCQRFCSYMDTMEKNYAEFGIDIAIDINKNLWLIEANVFPSFKGFKLLDSKIYNKIRYTPLLYALSLTQVGE